MTTNRYQPNVQKSLALLMAIGAILALSSLAHAAGATLQPLSLDDEEPQAAKDVHTTSPTGQSAPASPQATTPTASSSPGPAWLASAMIIVGLAGGIGASAWALGRRPRDPAPRADTAREDQDLDDQDQATPSGDPADQGIVFEQVPSSEDQASGQGRPQAPGSRIEEVPTGVPGLLHLGQEAVDRGDYETGATWFLTALDIDPDLAPAHLCLALCLEEMDETDPAIQHIEQAIEADPTDAMARYTHAQLLARHGRNQEAIEALLPLALESPEARETVLADPAFSQLRDHPRFLSILGAL